MHTVGFFRNGVDADIQDFSQLIPDLYNLFSDCLLRSNVVYYMSDIQRGQESAVSFVSDNETIVLCTHGCKDGLYYDYGLRQFLIDINNIEVIQNKCIVAISCWTLYPRSIFRTSHNKSKVFLGFQDEFFLAITPSSVPVEQRAVINMYADILINAIVDISRTQGTFHDLFNTIKRRTIAKSKEYKGFDSIYIHNALSKLESVDLVGDGATPFLPEPV